MNQTVTPINDESITPEVLLNTLQPVAKDMTDLICIYLDQNGEICVRTTYIDSPKFFLMTSALSAIANESMRKKLRFNAVNHHGNT